jgi:hypothetical protein
MVVAKFSLPLGCHSPFGLQHLIGISLPPMPLGGIEALEIRGWMRS